MRVCLLLLCCVFLGNSWVFKAFFNIFMGGKKTFVTEEFAKWGLKIGLEALLGLGGGGESQIPIEYFEARFDEINLKLDRLEAMVEEVDAKLSFLKYDLKIDDIITDVDTARLDQKITRMSTYFDDDDDKICGNKVEEGWDLAKVLFEDIRYDHANYINPSVGGFLNIVKGIPSGHSVDSIFLYSAISAYFFTFARYYFSSMFYLKLYEEAFAPGGRCSELDDGGYEFEEKINLLLYDLIELRNTILYHGNGNLKWRGDINVGSVSGPGYSRICNDMSRPFEIGWRYGSCCLSYWCNEPCNIDVRTCKKPFGGTIVPGEYYAGRCAGYFVDGDVRYDKQQDCVNMVSSAVDASDSSFYFGYALPMSKALNTEVEIFKVSTEGKFQYCTHIENTMDGLTGSVSFNYASGGKLWWKQLMMSGANIRHYEGSCLSDDEKRINYVRTSDYKHMSCTKGEKNGPCDLGGTTLGYFCNVRVREDVLLFRFSGSKLQIKHRNRGGKILYEDGMGLGGETGWQSCFADINHRGKVILGTVNWNTGLMKVFEVDFKYYQTYNVPDSKLVQKSETKVTLVYEFDWGKSNLLLTGSYSGNNNLKEFGDFEYQFMYYAYHPPTGRNEVGEFIIFPEGHTESDIIVSKTVINNY